MHAIVIENNQLIWREVPDPVAGDGEVVIDVTASAVNRADISQRKGTYTPPPGAPEYPGLECAGVISAVGPGVIGHHVGERVAALLAGGGYAERVRVPAGQLLPVPTGLSMQEAASLPEVACTVWSNVVDKGRLRKGETLLVHGGGSGIGSFAIQYGKALGATVVTTARKQKHDRLRDLGADLVIDYTADDFVTATKDFTGGAGADVVVDIIGAKYMARNVDVLAQDGRMLVIGTLGGGMAEIDLVKLRDKQGALWSTSLRMRSLAAKARIVAAVRRDVWPLVEAGAIKPIIDTRLPMSEAGEAHRLLEASEHLGKIVLLS